MNYQLKWISSHGDEWKFSVKEAAQKLLEKYFQIWGNRYKPIQLFYLASTLNTEIYEIDDLEGEARLIPNTNGFRLLINRSLKLQFNYGKYRTSIAHELVHTLFYSLDNKIPQRLIRPENKKEREKEENFCFDVARRILVPDWMIDEMGIRENSDSERKFRTLINDLKLSKDVAACVMLEDYQLASGVAGRWTKNNCKWILKRGYVYASPNLNEKQRKPLREMARRWLEFGVQSSKNCQLVGIQETSSNDAFVIVTIR